MAKPMKLLRAVLHEGRAANNSVGQYLSSDIEPRQDKQPQCSDSIDAQPRSRQEAYRLFDQLSRASVNPIPARMNYRRMRMFQIAIKLVDAKQEKVTTRTLFFNAAERQIKSSNKAIIASLGICLSSEDNRSTATKWRHTKTAINRLCQNIGGNEID